MLEKMVLTFSSLALATTLGGGYAWAQGGFEPTTDLAPVAREAAGVALLPLQETHDAQAPTGYGVLGSTAPSWGPVAVSVPASTDPTDTDASPARSGASAGTAAAPATSGAASTTPSSSVASSARTASAGADAAFGATLPETTTPETAVTAGTTTAASADPAAATGGTPTATTSTPAATPPATVGGGPSFNVASLNLLASSHTPPGSSRASGPTRMVGVVRLLTQYAVSVVGFQEMERDQHAAFERVGTGWASYPNTSTGKRIGQDTVAWRTDTWQLVKAASVLSPSWRGKEQPMPYVLLRHQGSGRTVYVSTFHNQVGRTSVAQGWREEATRRQVALANRLEATGVPQVMTGDMNEHDTWFCRMTAMTPLHSATGGTNNGACRPARPSGIDWVMGSAGIGFSGTVRDRGGFVASLTDHPVLVSTASLPKG